MQASMPWFLIIPAMVLGGLLTVAMIVGSVLFFSGRPRGGVRRAGGSLALVCGSFLLIAMVIFSSLTFPVGRMEFRHHSDGGPPRKFIKDAKNVDAGLTRLADDGPADALTPLPAQDDRTDRAPQPQWTATPLTTQGDVILTAISGQQFATIEEARHDVASEARKQLLADFEKTYNASARSLADLTDDDLRQIAVRQEFVETVERDFGNFFAPMHRVWWQVELSPAVRSELYPLWRGGEQQTRRRIVIFGFATATIGLALVSWLTRRKPVVQPPPQPAATNPVILGVGAATLLAQRCRRWWK